MYGTHQTAVAFCRLSLKPELQRDWRKPAHYRKLSPSIGGVRDLKCEVLLEVCVVEYGFPGLVRQGTGAEPEAEKLEGGTAV